MVNSSNLVCKGLNSCFSSSATNDFGWNICFRFLTESHHYMGSHDPINENHFSESSKIKLRKGNKCHGEGTKRDQNRVSVRMRVTTMI